MRRWRDRDRAPFAAMNADPEVMRYFPALLDRAGSDAIIDRLESLFDTQGFGLWALEVADSADFIGFTGLNPMPDGVPGAGGMEAAGAWPGARGITGTPPRPPAPHSMSGSARLDSIRSGR